MRFRQPGIVYLSNILTAGAVAASILGSASSAFADGGVTGAFACNKAMTRNSAPADAFAPQPALNSLRVTPLSVRARGDQNIQLALDIINQDGNYSRPESQLVALGDKKIIFNKQSSAFVMAAPSGLSMIAMTGITGKVAAFKETVTSFTEYSEAHLRSPVFYSVSPEQVPVLEESGFVVQKVGESAVIQLKDWNLDGKSKSALRGARNRMIKRGDVTFAVEIPKAGGDLLKDLKVVSDAWLHNHKATEKRFSLGNFDEAFLDGTPVGVVRMAGRPIAFVSMWVTPDGTGSSIDLMRFDPSHGFTGLMDYAMTESILWAKANGFSYFDLGMAPLSGMEPGDQSSLTTKLGHWLFKNGSKIYNFTGLRAYKEKFGPEWEPRFLAVKKGRPVLPAAIDALFVSNKAPPKKALRK